MDELPQRAGRKGVPYHPGSVDRVERGCVQRAASAERRLGPDSLDLHFRGGEPPDPDRIRRGGPAGGLRPEPSVPQPRGHQSLALEGAAGGGVNVLEEGRPPTSARSSAATPRPHRRRGSAPTPRSWVAARLRRPPP